MSSQTPLSSLPPKSPERQSTGGQVPDKDVQSLVDKAAAALPGYPPKEMSHAGVAPGDGSVILTNYVSDIRVMYVMPDLLRGSADHCKCISSC